MFKLGALKPTKRYLHSLYSHLQRQFRNNKSACCERRMPPVHCQKKKKKFWIVPGAVSLLDWLIHMSCLVSLCPLIVHSILSNLKYMLRELCKVIMDISVSVCVCATLFPSGSVSVLTIILNYQCVLQSTRRDEGEETQTWTEREISKWRWRWDTVKRVNSMSPQAVL